MVKKAHDIGELQENALAVAEACLCLQLRTAARRVVEFYDGELAAAGMSMAQFGLLNAIAVEADGAIAAIAKRLSLDPSTLSRTLRPLEEEGLIAIEADPGNLRARKVRLTKEGARRLAAAHPAWAAAQAKLSRLLDPGMVAAIAQASENLA